jgi:hypothetical protein
MDIHLYTLEDKDGNEVICAGGEFDSFAEAKSAAQEHRARLIDNTYEWSDSEMVEDYTGTNDDDD